MFLLETIAIGRDPLQFCEGSTLFSQGEDAEAIYFIQRGKVQLTTVSPQGMKAVLATKGSLDFLGEECLLGNSRRISTAIILEPSSVFGLGKNAMLQVLHDHPGMAEQFVISLLERSVKLEERLCNQLFNQRFAF